MALPNTSLLCELHCIYFCLASQHDKGVDGVLCLFCSPGTFLAGIHNVDCVSLEIAGPPTCTMPRTNDQWFSGCEVAKKRGIVCRWMVFTSAFCRFRVLGDCDWTLILIQIGLVRFQVVYLSQAEHFTIEQCGAFVLDFPDIWSPSYSIIAGFR